MALLKHATIWRHRFMWHPLSLSQFSQLTGIKLNLTNSLCKHFHSTKPSLLVWTHCVLTGSDKNVHFCVSFPVFLFWHLCSFSQLLISSFPKINISLLTERKWECHKRCVCLWGKCAIVTVEADVAVKVKNSRCTLKKTLHQAFQHLYIHLGVERVYFAFNPQLKSQTCRTLTIQWSVCTLPVNTSVKWTVISRHHNKVLQTFKCASKGYTLEMPMGTSVVKLWNRNREMLKRISGMWELNGSDWKTKAYAYQ